MWAVLDPREVTTEQARSSLDVALGESLGLPKFSDSFANVHVARLLTGNPA
jgi:hypothetical protein